MVGVSGGPARRSIAFARQAMGGDVLGSTTFDKLRFAGAATDSRAVTSGRLFFALRGERVDGFEYCAAAAGSGAAAVVVERERGRPSGCTAIPVIAVDDPRKALGDLARAVRREFRGRVVGITGSNGKTTTKELVAAALSSAGATLRTAGNFNTEVGLPLTILDSRGDESFWVLEMAMRARGEIALLAEIAEPHVGLVTNVAAAHLGRLGSLDEVAKAKGEIFHGLTADGIAVLPVDEPLLEPEAAHLPEARKRRFGGATTRPGGARHRRADVQILDFVSAGAAGSVVRFSAGEEPVVVRLPLAGEHNARNAAAALAAASACNVPLLPAAAALESAVLPPHRSRLEAIAGRTILDDCYNANPASMSAALQTLVASVRGSGRAFAVLGDMLELGPAAEELHTELGRQATTLGLAGLVTMGDLGAFIARGARAAGFPGDRLVTTDSPEAAAAEIARWSSPGDWILVKASRGMRLERTVAALQNVLGRQMPAGGR